MLSIFTRRLFWILIRPYSCVVFLFLTVILIYVVMSELHVDFVHIQHVSHRHHRVSANALLKSDDCDIYTVESKTP